MLLIAYLISICTSQWIQSTSTLPIATYQQAVGFYNESIFLLGGDANNNQLIEYKFTEDTFINHGSTSISNVEGYGQYYTQIGHKLYTKHYINNQISTFNLETKSFTESSLSNIPINPQAHACLASDSNHLYILGGRDNSNSNPLNSVQIYDLINDEWLSDTPSMIETRVDFPCIIHPKTNTLYAFAGFYTYNDALSSIEIINTNNITQNTWSYIDPLSQAFGYAVSVVYNDMILIIGGAYKEGNNWYCMDKVHTVNALTNDVSVSSDRLYLGNGISDVAPVIVNSILYVFGGSDDVAAVDTWMWYDLLKAFPSDESTVEPYEYYDTTSQDITLRPMISTASTASILSTDAPITSTTYETTKGSTIVRSSSYSTIDDAVTVNSLSLSLTSSSILFPSVTNVHPLAAEASLTGTKSTNNIFTSSNDTLLHVVIISFTVFVLCCIVIFGGYCYLAQTVVHKETQVTKQYPDTVRMDANRSVKMSKKDVDLECSSKNVNEGNYNKNTEFVEIQIECGENDVDTATECNETKGGLHDMYEYENNPNIADDEFIIGGDGTIGCYTE